MKKRVLSLIMAMGLILLAGCAKNGAEDAGGKSEAGAQEETQDASSEQASEEKIPEEQGEFVIGFDMSTDKSEYCLKFGNYVKELAEEAGMRPLVTQSDVDPMTQIQNAENWLTQDAKVVAGIWCDRDATVPVLDMCKDKNIPLVSTLTSIAGGEDYPGYIYIGSENYEGGYLQGEYLSSILDKEADNQIWYIAGPSGDQQSADRKKGFEDALEANGVSYTIAASLNVDGNIDDGVLALEDWVQAYGELQVVAGFNDSVILGGITAYESAGLDAGKTIWLGFDGSDGALESISQGKMTMTVFQDAHGQAEAFINVCGQIRDGADASEIEDINVPFKTVTKDNVSEFMGQ